MKEVILSRIQKQIELKSATSMVVSDHDVKQVAELIKKANKISVLTGAGISTMSGIPDYRGGTEALYQRNPQVMDHLNQSTFLAKPHLFWSSFYDLVALTLAALIPDESAQSVLTAIDLIQPNDGHRFFARLEESGKDVTIMTQNVDGLHQKAGSSQVLELHGNITTCSCYQCRKSFELKEVYEIDTVPTCDCGTVLYPDVVFFGDHVHGLDSAKKAVQASDLIIVAGTSLHVAPFNHLPYLAAENTQLININADTPEDRNIFDFVLQGNISEITRLLEKEM